MIAGHGPALAVTADLLDGLLDTFPDAPYADHCPDVAETLQTRLQILEDGEV